MKTILLHIGDNEYSDIWNSIQAKGLCNGFTGDNYLISMAWKKVLQAIEQGETEVTLQYKEKNGHK